LRPTNLIVVILAIFCQTNAQVTFVRQGGSGDGSSWSMAMGSLTEALHAATPGTQVWVAAGEYPATTGSDRSAAFAIPRGVQVYGGFEGTETSIEGRKSGANKTVLSGEIGAPGAADNAYNVVLLSGSDENTVLDGFTISGGNANGDVAEGKRMRSGGGMYIEGSPTASKPVISHCTFTGNFGRDGAAVYINGRGDNSCSPVFTGCNFIGNEAGLDGGAIYNDGRMNGKSNLTLTNCTFERNMGTYGGAICNATETGVCNLTLENCTFTENVALLRGGAVFSLNGDEKCYLEISGCSFTSNYPDDQNMVFTSNAARTKAYKVERTDP
jgi:predicted outer membrane repeat protein